MKQNIVVGTLVFLSILLVGGFIGLATSSKTPPQQVSEQAIPDDHISR